MKVADLYWLEFDTKTEKTTGKKCYVTKNTFLSIIEFNKTNLHFVVKVVFKNLNESGFREKNALLHCILIFCFSNIQKQFFS